jgi:hypothetical protein
LPRSPISFDTIEAGTLTWLTLLLTENKISKRIIKIIKKISRLVSVSSSFLVKSIAKL